MPDDMIFRPMRPGAEVTRVIGAYGQSVALSERVQELLRAMGLGAEAVLVVPSLTEAGEPVVWLTPLTDTCLRTACAN